MRRFEVGDYVIIYNPKKDNVSFELNRLALKHEGMLGRIFKIKDILDMQVCSMKLEDGTITAYGQFELRFAEEDEIREIDIRDVLPRVRGFEIVKDEFRKHPDVDIVLPRRGSSKAMAYDFYSPIDVIIKPNEIVKIWSDICAYMNDNECLILNIRSSQGGKVMLTSVQGWIDADYINASNGGNIGIFLKNISDEDYIIHKGDRIAQGAFMNYLVSDNGNVDDERTGGFGSSGR